MAQTYLISTGAAEPVGQHRSGLRYAALADSPEEAIESVRRLVSREDDLRWTGDTLSAAATVALGLRKGQARLV